MSPKTKQKSKPTTAPTPAAVKQAIAAFDKVIEQALKQFRDPAALGEQSPLAATYFLLTELPVHQIIHELHLAEATYHRHRNDAIHQLAQEVMRQVKPALRLE